MRNDLQSRKEVLSVKSQDMGAAGGTLFNTGWKVSVRIFGVCVCESS